MILYIPSFSSLVHVAFQKKKKKIDVKATEAGRITALLQLLLKALHCH